MRQLNYANFQVPFIKGKKICVYFAVFLYLIPCVTDKSNTLRFYHQTTYYIVYLHTLELFTDFILIIIVECQLPY